MKKNASPKEQRLYHAIVNGDDLALSKLYDLYGKEIIGSLKSWYRKSANKDDAPIFEAVNEAFFGYYKNPTTFNPKLNTLKRLVLLI